MNVDPYIVLGSAVVGFLVGLTGAGGGALMTPMLILLFGVKPSTAISSDLVAAVFMRPFGAAVHISKKTVNFRLVGWMVAGSVPMAFLGAYLLHLMGHAKTSQANIEKALGAALLVGAAAMVIRSFLDRRGSHERRAAVHDLVVRPAPTVLIGMVGGLIVGMTSVGSGSLMIVMLLFLYPMLAFGHVEFSVTTSIIIGSIPAVVVGSFISSRAPDKYIRPAITFVIFASGLKYVGLGTTALGWVLCATLLAVAAIWLSYVRPWQNGAPLTDSAVTGDEPDESVRARSSP